MLKLIHLTKIFPAALILLTAKVAFSQPVSGSSRLPVVPSSKLQPDCYLRRADGTTLDLSSLCGKATNSTPSADQSEEWSDADHKKYETDLNDLMNRRQQLPDSNTIRQSICNYEGKCPSRTSNISIGPGE